jgi:hypothetical protein
MAKRIAVVVSQGQSQHPAKRKLEEDIVANLLFEAGIDVTVIPHLYDLQSDGTGTLALQGIKGHFILLSWLYERAARWTLDRHQIRGLEGPTLIRMESEDEDDEDIDSTEDDKLRVIDQRDVPARKIYCVDLRVHDAAQPYIDEIKRIVEENNQQVVQLSDWLQGDPGPAQLERFHQPLNSTALGEASGTAAAAPPEDAQPTRVEEETPRRWYPVIDFSRCTNCMECIDFCLFGVYGVDAAETILVEQPDNCRKGCPACSRVCPENAIMFPQHKTPAIAGSPVMLGGLKIDLSKLFGAPESDKSAIEIAANERDEQLMLAGRDTVGLSVGIPRRQIDAPDEPKDELDDLIDALDDMDL